MTPFIPLFTTGALSHPENRIFSPGAACTSCWMYGPLARPEKRNDCVPECTTPVSRPATPENHDGVFQSVRLPSNPGVIRRSGPAAIVLVGGAVRVKLGVELVVLEMVAVGVTVTDGVIVAVAVDCGVALSVRETDGVEVDVRLGDAVGEAEDEGLEMAVGVRVSVRVGVDVLTGVRVDVFDATADGVTVPVPAIV